MFTRGYPRRFGGSVGCNRVGHSPPIWPQSGGTMIPVDLFKWRLKLGLEKRWFFEPTAWWKLLFSHIVYNYIQYMYIYMYIYICVYIYIYVCMYIWGRVLVGMYFFRKYRKIRCFYSVLCTSWGWERGKTKFFLYFLMSFRIDSTKRKWRFTRTTNSMGHHVTRVQTWGV